MAKLISYLITLSLDNIHIIYEHLMYTVYFNAHLRLVLNCIGDIKKSLILCLKCTYVYEACGCAKMCVCKRVIFVKWNEITDTVVV